MAINTVTAPSAQDTAALIARLQALEAENAKLKASAAAKIRLAVSAKGAVSLYGLRRFPVTFYKEEFLTLFEQQQAILEFIQVNDAALKGKEDADDDKPAK